MKTWKEKRFQSLGNGGIIRILCPGELWKLHFSGRKKQAHTSRNKQNLGEKLGNFGRISQKIEKKNPKIFRREPRDFLFFQGKESEKISRTETRTGNEFEWKRRLVGGGGIYKLNYYIKEKGRSYYQLSNITKPERMGKRMGIWGQANVYLYWFFGFSQSLQHVVMTGGKKRITLKKGES